ncbi:hypothetical protein HDE_02382 [Halotydeus destructor]|nr:hypothetical protein HDE_02382 [Halotydeus destructor]
MDPEVDVDLNDPELEKAATKIQATFKGYKARQEIKGKTDADNPIEEPAEEIDIDLNDPDVAKAATKIQATFRGYQTRKADKKEDEN